MKDLTINLEFKTTDLFYLATPYSHIDSAVRVARFKAVNRLAAKLMCKGLNIYSAISHTHPIAVSGRLPKEWEYWKNLDTIMLSKCIGIIIYTQPGWQSSKGVIAEIEIAEKLGLSISHLRPQKGEVVTI